MKSNASDANACTRCRHTFGQPACWKSQLACLGLPTTPYSHPPLQVCQQRIDCTRLALAAAARQVEHRLIRL